MEIKRANRDWLIRTDDWGYIERAYYHAKDGTDTYWSDYDIFLPVLITAGLACLYWVVTNVYMMFQYTDREGVSGYRVSYE